MYEELTDEELINEFHILKDYRNLLLQMGDKQVPKSIDNRVEKAMLEVIRRLQKYTDKHWKE